MPGAAGAPYGPAGGSAACANGCPPCWGGGGAYQPGWPWPGTGICGGAMRAGRQLLLEPGLLVDGRAVVDGALRHPHVRLLQRGLVRRQLPQAYVGVVREVADAGQRQSGDPQRAVLLGQHLAARLGQRGRQLLALLRLGVRGAHPREVGRVVRR